MMFQHLYGLLTIAGWSILTKSEPVLYWTVNELDGHESCLYSLEGDPSTWVRKLTLGGDVIADPLCVNKTLFGFGPLVADVDTARQVFIFDSLGGGLTTFKAEHFGDVESFFSSPINLMDIAIDKVHQNLYYTDPETGIVLVSYKTNKSHFRILTDDINMPHGIAVDVDNGSVFWCDTGSKSIKRMGLAGDGISTIVHNLSKPTLLTFDAESRTLYWLDEGKGSLEAWMYNDTGTRHWTVLTSDEISQGVFSGLEVYQKYLFGILSKEMTLVVWDKSTGVELTSLSFDVTGNLTQYGISMAVSNPTNVQNPCTSDNGGCDHVCVFDKKRDLRQCLCEFGYTLQSDGRSCRSEFVDDDFVLVSDLGTNRLYQVELGSGVVHGIPVQRTTNQRLEAVTYDPSEKEVYWVDTGNNTLRKISLEINNPVEEIVYVFSSGSVVEGLAFDILEREIYYTDMGMSRIGKISSKSRAHTTILTLTTKEYPLNIQLDSHGGMMYWTNVGFPATIERARMSDGAGRETLVNTELQVPSGLALNFKDSKMYWSDEGMWRIERSSPDGSDREMLYSLKETFSLTLDNDFMYTSLNHEIRRFSFGDSTQTTLGPKFFSDIYGLHLYSSKLEGKTTTPTKGPSSGTMITGSLFVVFVGVVCQKITSGSIIVV